MKVAVFDFCDTLVNFQTADAFVEYAIEKICIKKRRMLLKIASKLDELTKHKYLPCKKAFLYHLKGQKRDDLEKVAQMYYQEKIKNNLNQPILKILKEYQRSGYQIVISSGGYSIYIKEFCKEYGITILHAGDFLYKRDYFSGRLFGKDCIRSEKVIRLNRLYNGCDIELSIAYSDSKSDLPLLLWASKGVVVSKHKHRQWCSNYDLDELILAECNELAMW